MNLTFKRAGASLLSALMLASAVVPSTALEGYNGVRKAGGTGQSNITVTVNEGTSEPEDPIEGSIFSAYVPAELPIVTDTDGVVTVPTDAKIINANEHRGIKVTDISVTFDDGWSGEEFNADYDAIPTNSKVVGLKFRDDEMAKDGTFTLTDGDWNIAKNSYIDLNMQAKLARWDKVGDQGRAAVANFTLDWSGDNDTTGPAIPEDIVIDPITSEVQVRGNTSEIEVGSTSTILVSVPDGVTVQSLFMDDESVAKVELKGGKALVTGVAAGSAKMTVVTDDDKSFEFDITVTSKN